MSSFHKKLSSFHRRWRLGRLIYALLMLSILLTLAMLIHGWADYKLALSPEVRSQCNLVIRALVVLAGVIWLYRILKTPREHSAAMVDKKLADPRQQVQAAASLEKINADSAMQQFHLERALKDASSGMETLPWHSRMPIKSMAKAAGGLALVAAGIGGLYHWANDPFRITAARVLDPDSDIAPYSPLVFAVTPNALSSLYGGEAVAEVRITGGEIEDEVYCLVRDRGTGRVDKVAAYRESPNSYARKFSNTLNSVDFAFATGRARSAWYPLDVLLQPKLSAAMITVQPPAYTGVEAEIYPLESGEIKVLEGSTLTLDIESNRPLSSGAMKVAALNTVSGARTEEVQGDALEAGSVRFSWTAHSSSYVSAMIYDVRSTPAEAPLEFKVQVIADQVPVVDLNSPEQMVLATPQTELPFKAEVEDDHGLAKVSMVRSLVGFRDRGRVLADSLVKKKFDFNEPLRLSELGVEEGQVLEFYFEAMDRNPSLLGQGVSEVVRVKIISEKEYAERIRSKVQLREFTARYRALSDAIRQSKEALAKLDKAANTGEPKDFADAKKDAESAHGKAEELAEKMANDFKAFAMENRLSEIAKEAAGKLAANKAGLAKMSLASGEANARRQIAEMQKRLGGVEKQAEQVAQDAEHVQKVGAVTEMAAQFKKIHRAQKSILERMQVIGQEVAFGDTRNTAQLKNLGRQEKLNREAIMNLATELKKRSDDLPEGFEQMQQDVEQFLQTLADLDIPDPMKASADASTEGKTTDAIANAQLALSLMDQLINKPNNGF